jgi:uncharacterized protein (TIGR02453 family)
VTPASCSTTTPAGAVIPRFVRTWLARQTGAIMRAMAGFRGFSKSAPGFFHQLAAEMSRDWFKANKDTYDNEWVAPMTALLEDVRAKLAPIYKGTPLQEPKVFRIQRDVRFAKDKAPYKTTIGAFISTGKGTPMETGAAVYVQLGLEEFAGAGYYVFSPEQLARWRKKVAADKTGKEIAALIAAAAKKGMSIDAHEVLARAPRGVDPEHSRVELLRHKGCVLSFSAIPRGLIHKPAFSGWLADQAKAAAPVVRWLQKHVA